MSPDTSWSMRRSCTTTEADCARPPRWGSSPPGSETLRLWSTCVLGVSRQFLDHLRPLEKGACNDIIPNAVESDALFTCDTRKFARAVSGAQRPRVWRYLWVVFTTARSLRSGRTCAGPRMGLRSPAGTVKWSAWPLRWIPATRSHGLVRGHRRHQRRDDPRSDARERRAALWHRRRAELGDGEYSCSATLAISGERRKQYLVFRTRLRWLLLANLCAARVNPRDVLPLRVTTYVSDCGRL